MRNNTTTKSSLTVLSLAALGVVYGDIGTSPLYAFKEAFGGAHALLLTEANVLATLSTMFWSIMLIISLKYVWIVLGHDNEGEGGVLALTALAQRITHRAPRWSLLIVGSGIFAAALFYGDAVITPAISVLSAIEGISVATPRFEHLIIPITIGILVALFVIQRHGTGRVGVLFGPITVLWFLSLAVLGIRGILDYPVVLYAINPMYAITFAMQQPTIAFLLLSAVFLALTGGEALYADMGHFGAKPVRLAWSVLVCPSLLLNYFGQGALVLHTPAAVQNPFYLLAPEWLLLPLVALAAAATVIASQATITGAYSMTLQATRLGYLPRVRVLHTSDTERGQIYIPAVNWLMLVAVIILVLQFGSSSALAAAYGIAVSGTMIITTLLTILIALLSASRSGKWQVAALTVLGCFELLFFSSNLMKIADGGWMPLALGACIFLLLTTWKKGSALLAQQRHNIDIPMTNFLTNTLSDVPRVPGTAVYLTSDPSLVPSALFHNLKHYNVMHECIVFLHVIDEEVPYVDDAMRLEATALTPDTWNITLRYGFREEPDLPAALAQLPTAQLTLEPLRTTFFLARSTIVESATSTSNMARWRRALFGWMTRQSESAGSWYQLPPNRVVELGTQVTL